MSDSLDCAVHGILLARILEWVAFRFSRVSSQPRDWTQVQSHITGGFFTSWAIREAQVRLKGQSTLWFRSHPICNLVWLWSPNLKYGSWRDYKSVNRLIYAALKQEKQSHGISAGKWNPHWEVPACSGIVIWNWGEWSTPPSLNLSWLSALKGPFQRLPWPLGG